jgi:hypothetical protein
MRLGGGKGTERLAFDIVNPDPGAVLDLSNGQAGTCTFQISHPSEDPQWIEPKLEGLERRLGWFEENLHPFVGTGEFVLHLKADEEEPEQEHPFTVSFFKKGSAKVVKSWVLHLRIVPASSGAAEVENGADSTKTKTNANKAVVRVRRGAGKRNTIPTGNATGDQSDQGASDGATAESNDGADSTGGGNGGDASTGGHADGPDWDSDYGTAPNYEEKTRDFPDEKVAVRLKDPADDTPVSLDPGQRALIYFSVDFSAQVQDWTLEIGEELRTDFYEHDPLLKGHADASVGAPQLAFVLNIPLKAEPEEQDFSVYRFNSAHSFETRLRLRINPKIAVALAPSASEPDVKERPVPGSKDKEHYLVRWFKRDFDIPFQVRQAGNCRTAYRLTIKSGDGKAKPKDIYSNGPFALSLDRELENTPKLDNQRRDPEDVPQSTQTGNVHHLRFFRRGFWWFGREERAQVTVVGVPVTRPDNNSYSNNRILLTAIRRRLLPVPWFVVATPLLFLVLFIFGAASNLKLLNSLPLENGQRVVLEELADKDARTRESTDMGIEIPLRLSWDANFFARLQLEVRRQDQQKVEKPHSGAANDLSVNVPIAPNDLGTDHHAIRLHTNYDWSKPQEVDAYLLPVRSYQKLGFFVRQGIYQARKSDTSPDLDPIFQSFKPDRTQVETDAGRFQGSTYRIRVDGTVPTVEVVPYNLSPQRHVLIYLLKAPRHYKVGNLSDQGSLSVPERSRRDVGIALNQYWLKQPLTEIQQQRGKMAMNQDGGEIDLRRTDEPWPVGEHDEIQFVTTDFGAQVVTIELDNAGASPSAPKQP